MATHNEIITRFARDAGKPNAHMLRSANTNVIAEQYTLYSYGSHFTLAKIMSDGDNTRAWWLVNGDNYSVSTTRHQSMTRGALESTGLPMLLLPFSALQEADIDRSTVKPLEILPDGWSDEPQYAATAEEVPQSRRWSGFPETYSAADPDGYYATLQDDGRWTWLARRHWLGASVFTAEYSTNEWVSDPEGPDYRSAGHGRGYSRHVSRTATFLSAFDENETRSMYFLAQLPDGATPATVAEALEALKPPEVTAAEAAGLTVQRQGDVFAIPLDTTTRRVRTEAVNHEISRAVYVLSVNHTASESAVTADGRTLARGILRHRPRESWRRPEHRNVKLGDGRTWHRLVKNNVPMDSRGQSRAWAMGGRVD
jgi:hypothetical protein